jgi:hypothetical protein
MMKADGGRDLPQAEWIAGLGANVESRAQGIEFVLTGETPLRQPEVSMGLAISASPMSTSFWRAPDAPVLMARRRSVDTKVEKGEVERQRRSFLSFRL